MNKLSTLLVFVFFTNLLFSQRNEVLTPCQVFPFASPKHGLVKTNSSSLTLPFYDDFSSTYGHVDTNKYVESTAFVNRSFARNERTIGTLLLDALDENGNPYEIGDSYHFLADSVVSKPIRLDSIFTGIPRKITASDSVYFSFFYQPQGLGDAPDENDSLVLEFYSSKYGRWIRVWADKGSSYQDFSQQNPTGWKYVVIPITDTMFFDPHFKFKFMNFASYANTQFPTWSSNGDFWLLDCIYLNANRTMQDSMPADLAFKTDMLTLLSDYTTMPWKHYLAAPAQMISTLSVPYKNYSQSILNVTEKLIAQELGGTGTNFISPTVANNLYPYHDTTFKRSPLPFSFSSSQTENVAFKIQLCINTNTILDSTRSNDTITIYQRFYNYFAIDDGTAEAGYGLSFAQGEFTLQFTLYVPDTLRAVMLFFNRTFYQTSENPLFDIVIRSDHNGFPGEIIYEQKYLLPQYDGYHFITYVLDQPVAVHGTIYVGLRQHLNQSINIGFDQNTHNKGRLFYNTTGDWFPSLYTGVPMIRPIVGHSSEPYVYVDEVTNETIIFPNPATNGQIITIQGIKADYVHVYDAFGKLIITTIPLHNQFTLPTGISKGMYFLIIQDEDKLIYQRLLVE